MIDWLWESEAHRYQQLTRRMAMGTKTRVSAAIVVMAVGLYFVTRTPAVESAQVERDALAIDVEGAGAELLSVAEDPAAKGVRRSPVVEGTLAGESGDERARLLRVILDGIADEEARSATVAVTGVKVSDGRRTTIQDAWPCQGRTNEFDLDPFFARVEEQPGALLGDELRVVVDHSLHFSEKASVALSSGVESTDGRTVYEVTASFAEVLYWPELTLSVRDTRTREHLEDVELRLVPTAYMGLVQQPGASDPFTVVGEGLASPIVMRGGRKAGEPEELAAGVALRPANGDASRPVELVQPEENARGVMMYAHAPGYAWGRLVLDVSKGSKRELLLHQGAELSVRLANVQPERYAALEKEATLFVRRVEPNGDESTVWSRELDETLDSEVLRIDALEAGEYVALVELTGSWRRKPTELGRESILVPAGEARELLLAVPDPPEPPAHANLAGVVSFPSFGGEENVRLEFYGADYRYGDPDAELTLTELEPVAAARPTWSFRVEDLAVGRYQVRLQPFLKSWMVELPEGGREDVELVIPELAEALFETVEARTGERVAIEALAYRELEVVPGQVTHGGSGPWHAVDFEDEPGRFRIWMAPGSMAVRLGSAPEGVDYSFHSEEFELAAGLQTMRLELTRACTIRVEFRVDGAALPHEDVLFHSLSRRFRPVGHDGRVGGMYPYSLLEASAPGLYEIEFGELGTDRFRQIPTQQVEVNAGEITDVIVELQRE